MSDGQLFYPKEKRDYLQEDIERYGKIKGDLVARKARAERYDKEAPALLSAIVEDRDKLERITESFKAHSQLGNVRYGVSGPTLEQVSEMLALTA